MDTKSYWNDTARLPRFPRVTGSPKVDVVVIGGGITGITAAHLLKQRGATVALVERERCGGVDTAYTTAHLTQVTDQRLHALVDHFGKAQAKAVWDAGRAAIDHIVSNIRKQGISCDFSWVPGYLHARPGEVTQDARAKLAKDAALANELGFRAKLLSAIPYFEVPGVEFPHQALFHPLKYLAGLLKTIPGGGSYVFERTAVDEVEPSPLGVRSGIHKIRCKYVVIATHTPLTGLTNIVSATLFQTKLYLYTSYVAGARVPRGVLPHASFWDTGDPYDYLRVERRRGFDYAIFGGQDHKTGQEVDTEACYRRLESSLQKAIPGAKVDHHWSGQVIETNDGLPFIGETAERQFVATGFSGNGMTFGTLGGMMAADAYFKQSNPWRELFAVTRKKLRGGLLAYIKENKDYPYYLVRDRLAPAKARSLRSVRRGQGKIVHVKGKKVAAYRDPDGTVTCCSPVCTHLGCIVAWNDAEHTWDCPCHGSRFKATGEVMSGPAEENLERL